MSKDKGSANAAGKGKLGRMDIKIDVHLHFHAPLIGTVNIGSHAGATVNNGGHSNEVVDDLMDALLGGQGDMPSPLDAILAGLRDAKLMAKEMMFFGVPKDMSDDEMAAEGLEAADLSNLPEEFQGVVLKILADKGLKPAQRKRKPDAAA
jgi:hypothetical protein